MPNQLIETIGPESAGILWVSQGDVDLTSPDMHQLNYLLNGLLGQTLKTDQTKVPNGQHFFLGENFGTPFFVALINLQQCDFNKTSSMYLDMVKNLYPSSKKIYLYNQTNQNDLKNGIKYLTKNFGHNFQFELLKN